MNKFKIFKGGWNNFLAMFCLYQYNWTNTLVQSVLCQTMLLPLFTPFAHFNTCCLLGSHPVWPRDSFGSTLTSAQKYFGPEYFGPEILRPETTSARKILRPAYILRPGNNFGPDNTSARLYTSAWKYFGPIDFGPLNFCPGTKLSKVSFFIIFDLP